MLATKPRDLALFTLGINTNLRASDPMRIRVGQVRDLKPGDELEVKEKKTGKTRRITLNRAAVKAVQGMLKAEEYTCEDYLFKSRKGPILWFLRCIGW